MKSKLIAHLLFLIFGAHHFYLGKIGSGMLIYSRESSASDGSLTTYS